MMAVSAVALLALLAAGSMQQEGEYGTVEQ
jgi:hypothetical protein